MKIAIIDILAGKAAEGSEITAQGWVRTRRDAKGFSFLEINDGSCLANLQVVADEKLPTYEAVKNATTGAAVSIDGLVVPSQGGGQKWELRAEKVALVGPAPAETYPLQKKRHSDEFLREIAHLRPRTNKFGAIFRLRSHCSRAVHDFFHSRGFFYVHTPIITGSDCEGAGELFRVTTLPPGPGKPEPQRGNTPPQVNGDSSPEAGNSLHKSVFAEDFFGKEAGLTVSGQLEGEMLALALGKVYTFGPTFRAENSNTPRHAAEFWMIEPEAAFFDIFDNMELAEGLIKHVVGFALKECREDLGLFDRFVEPGLFSRLENLVAEDYVRLPYAEAIDILKSAKKNFDYKPDWGIDLQTEHERHLCEDHFKKPVIVYDYPSTIKPFYMRLSDDGRTVAAMDLLVPKVGELVGGSQREERLDVLTRRMEEMKLNLEDYWWYLDSRRFGSAPHSGFGLGFERLLMMLTGVGNIRDVIPFPRTPNNLEF